MFRRAEAWGWASKNPMRIATRPRRKSQKREPVLLGPAEVEMIRSAMGPRDAALVSVLAYAGLRPGEALALTWADITQTHIRVDKALSMGQLRGTKTGKERRVPLIAPLRSDLTQWRMRIGGAKDHELVFPNFAGEHWSESDRHSWSGRHLKPALKEAGLPREVRMYDLRHSYVSMLIASGLNPVEVSRRAGHSATMTLDVYAHVYEEWEGRRIVIEDEIRKVRNLDVAATPAITSSE
jgi:integrase